MADVLDHVGFQCADLAASAAFYDVALEPLGGQRIMDFGVAIGYGVPDRPDFWISAQETGDGFRESHISFTAPSRAHAHQLRGPSRRGEDRRLAALGVSRHEIAVRAGVSESSAWKYLHGSAVGTRSKLAAS